MKVVNLLLLTLIATTQAQSDPASLVSYEEKFLQGVKAYTQQKWKDCILHMR